MNRYKGLDQLRGLAVILMIIFHFTYDHWLFGHNNLSFKEGFWFALPRIIVFLFLWCVGASLVIVHGTSIKWPSFNKRLIKLVVLALVISSVTYFLFPKNWIYFGTIHCIAAVSVLSLPFLKYPRARLPVLLLIVIAQYGLGFGISWVYSLTKHQSMDFIPIYPWFWVTLLGMITGPQILKIWPQKLELNLFKWAGQNALKIYLIHQPLFYGLFSLYAWIKRS
jgi:uncharacterized membrane protein